MQEIKNNSGQTIYYICKDGTDIKAYGNLEPNQHLATNRQLILQYTVKSEWLTELNNNNIDTREL